MVHGRSISETVKSGSLDSLLCVIVEILEARYSLAAICCDTLSRRYQIEENLWTIRTLKVYVYTNGTFNATYLIALSIVIFNNEAFSKPVYYALIEVFNVVYLYALALPLVLWYNRKDVQNQIRYAVDRNMAMNYTRIFEALQSHWNSGDVIPQKRMVTVASQLFKKRVSASKQ
ncbi:hypothetical protein RB195_016326 [Necator americanus]|uniref:Uncharacterized protein n=1 Tax=Necator americanus TaxID=51031 RepID=A0ABR1E974_NECAM